MLDLTEKPKKSTPKYLRLRDRLKRDIRDGVYPRGGKLPSCRDLTSILGVSYVTVTNVLQALEDDGYIKRVHGKGTFVTSPKPGQTVDAIKVGYIIDVNVSIFGRLFSTVLDSLKKQPVYNVPLNMPPETQVQAEEAERWLDDAMHNHYNILVVYGDRHFPYRRLTRYMAEIDQLNFIVFGNSGVKFPNANRFLVDVEKAGYLAASRFLANGRRKMAVLSLRQLDDMYRRRYGVTAADQGKLMLDGIERAYGEYGLDFFQLVKVVAGPDAHDKNDVLRFDKELNQCFMDDYAAFYTIGDFRAQQVYTAAEKLKLIPGKDIGVISFLNTPICQYLNPTLSSICINEPEIGRLTAQAIMEKWQGKTVMIEPELIIRDSDL